MILKKGFEIRSLAGRNIVVPASGNIDFTNVLSLNETASFIWKLMEKGAFTTSSIAGEVAKAFDVAEEQARQDVDEFIVRLRSLGMLEE